MKFEWEVMHEFNLCNDVITTSRSKVFGGWIVKHSMAIINERGLSCSESMVLISDPTHEWSIE
jgi:hypothetical protein